MKIKGIVLAYGLLALPLYGGQETEVCDNKNDGLPIATEDKVICDVRKEITELEGITLLERTGGLVSNFKVQSQISFDLIPTTEEDMLKIDQIDIPEQVVNAKMSLVDGPDLDVVIGIQPKLSFTGNDVCTIKPNAISVEVTRFETSLDDWLDRIIQDYFNQEQLFADTLMKVQSQVLDF